MRLRAAALALSGLVLASSGAAATEPAVNLTATPAVRSALRATYLSHVTGVPRAKVKGPLPGTLYYARHRGREWAIAAFSRPLTGTTDQPELFVRPVGGRWIDRGDTAGGLDVCAPSVPAPVLRVWGLFRRCDG